MEYSSNTPELCRDNNQMEWNYISMPYIKSVFYKHVTMSNITAIIQKNKESNNASIHYYYWFDSDESKKANVLNKSEAGARLGQYYQRYGEPTLDLQPESLIYRASTTISTFTFIVKIILIELILFICLLATYHVPSLNSKIAMIMFLIPVGAVSLKFINRSEIIISKEGAVIEDNKQNNKKIIKPEEIKINTTYRDNGKYSTNLYIATTNIVVGEYMLNFPQKITYCNKQLKITGSYKIVWKQLLLIKVLSEMGYSITVDDVNK